MKKSGGWWLLLLAIPVVLGILVWNEWNILQEKLSHRELPVEQTESTIQQEASVLNVALFGVDARNGETKTRSDVIMVASINPKTGTVRLASLLRDTLVEIPGFGPGKLNRAYFEGGPSLAMETINSVFGLEITEYATVDFSQLAAIVDALGGVEIEITEAERQSANNSIYEQAAVAGLPVDLIENAGLQTLTGTQALAYARIRHVETMEGTADDFGRTDRQRILLTKLFQKAKSNPLKYTELAGLLLEATDTSLTLGDVLGLTGMAFGQVEITDARFPSYEHLQGTGTVLLGQEQCLDMDLPRTRTALHTFLFGE